MKKLTAMLVLVMAFTMVANAGEVITYETVDGLGNVGKKIVTTTTVIETSDNKTIEALLEDKAGEVTVRAALKTAYDTNIAASQAREKLIDADITAFRGLGVEEVGE